MAAPREPTAEECNARSPVDGGWAAWYPQMGGYTSRCVAVPDEGGCWDVCVWHDGDFPFEDDDGPPRQLHHCDPDQFVQFGLWLDSKIASRSGEQPGSPHDSATSGGEPGT